MSAYPTETDTDEALTMGFDGLTDAERATLAANLTMDLTPAGAGTDLVPAAVEGEWISRAARLAILEREADAARVAMVRAHYEYGDILREYKELCIEDGTQWGAFCQRQEITLRWADALIQVATTVRALPALKDLAAKSVSKVLALIQGTDAETLEQIADGRGPVALDDVDSMPVSKLKKELRREREQRAQLVSEETKTLKSETEALREDLAAARAALDPDIAAVRKSARRVRQIVQDLAEACDQLSEQLAPLQPEHVERLRLDLETAIQNGTRRLQSSWQEWQDRVLSMGLVD